MNDKTLENSANSAEDIRADTLDELNRSSPLLLLLRALYSHMLDYAVYAADDGRTIILSKEQLVVLVERGMSASPISDLPALAAEGLFRPVPINDLRYPDEIESILIERGGTVIRSIERAVSRPSVEYPKWWEAPIPFAMCTREGLKLNSAAISMFGADLQRLRVGGIPDKDEFIVEIQGRNAPCFMAFKRLKPDIFTLEDCTGDMVEAQDITWWAAVGRAWIKSSEAAGQTWQREESVPEGFDGLSWRCEWQGRFQGYLCISGIAAAPEPAQETESEPEPKPVKTRKRAIRGRTGTRKKEELREDDLIKSMGPQTMALIAAGQPRDTA